MHVKGTDKQADDRISTLEISQAVRGTSDLPARAWGCLNTPPDKGHPLPQYVSAPPARGRLPLAGGRCAPLPDGALPEGGGQSREGEGLAAMPPPANRVMLEAGGNRTPSGASRREGGGSQAPPQASRPSEAGVESAPPAAVQPQAGDEQASRAESRPPAATLHPPPVPKPSAGAPGESSADTPAAGYDQPAGHDQPVVHDQPAGHDQPVGQDKPAGQYKLAAATCAPPPVRK